MRKGKAAIAIAVLASAAALALASSVEAWGRIEAAGRAPDVTVVYAGSPAGFEARRAETLYRHGGSIRIDKPHSSGAQDQTFWNLDQTTVLNVVRSPDGRPVSLMMQDRPDGYVPPMAARTFTGAEETYLGERCRVWRFSRPLDFQGGQYVESGCVSGNGIEIWRNFGNSWGRVAKSISYRPLAPSHVRPPTEFLKVATWLPSGPQKIDHSHDYEVIFGTSSSSDARAVARRSGAWTMLAEGEAWQTERAFRAVNLDARIWIEFRSETKGRRWLNIRSGEGVLFAKWGENGGPVQSAQVDDLVLGEKCQWWDLTPMLLGRGESECRTSDGIPVEVLHSQALVATRIRRGPQPLSAVLPGKDIISPAAWGF
jgi:hypothetical protein